MTDEHVEMIIQEVRKMGANVEQALNAAKTLIDLQQKQITRQAAIIKDYQQKETTR